MTVESWIESQRARLHHDPAQGLPAPFETLTAVRDGRRVVVRFVPGNGNPDALVLTKRSPRTNNAELRLLGLSAREAEVVQLLASGATNAEIGTQLHAYTSGTVREAPEHDLPKARRERAGASRVDVPRAAPTTRP